MAGRAALAALAAMALAMALPPGAHASVFGDLIGLNGWIKELFCSMVNSMFGFVFSILQSIGANDLLVGTWEDLFGGGTNAVYRFATDVCNGIVKPIAGSILSFVMLVQLVKVSGRMDAGGTLPAVREVLTLVVMFTVFTFLISNADRLCAALYEVVNNVAVYIDSYSPPWGDQVAAIQFADPADIDSVEVGDFMVALVSGLVTLLAAMAAYVIALLMAYARAIQLYLYMTFSPIPMALLGFDETRQMGVGFLKNFAAVCLAGAVMVFLLIAFPFIAASVLDFSGVDYLGLSGLLNILKVVAVCLLLAFALIKSGSTARDVLGG